MMDDEDDQKQHYNLKKLVLPENEGKMKKKRRMKEEGRALKVKQDTFHVRYFYQFKCHVLLCDVDV